MQALGRGPLLRDAVQDAHDSDATMRANDADERCAKPMDDSL
jgi:hypothetical protein